MSAVGSPGQWAALLKVILAGSFGDSLCYTHEKPSPCISEDAVVPWTSASTQSAGQEIQYEHVFWGFQRITQLATNKAGPETQNSYCHQIVLRPRPGEKERAWRDV